MRLRTKVEVVSAAAVVVLLAAAVYEVLVAVGVLSLGSFPVTMRLVRTSSEPRVSWRSSPAWGRHSRTPCDAIRAPRAR
jgi:hypothetical protein